MTMNCSLGTGKGSVILSMDHWWCIMGQFIWRQHTWPYIMISMTGRLKLWVPARKWVSEPSHVGCQNAISKSINYYGHDQSG